jgi:hypothetical protein
LGLIDLKEMLKLMLVMFVRLWKQRAEELDHEMKRLRKELEIEKVEMEVSFAY